MEECEFQRTGRVACGSIFSYSVFFYARVDSFQLVGGVVEWLSNVGVSNGAGVVERSGDSMVRVWFEIVFGFDW